MPFFAFVFVFVFVSATAAVAATAAVDISAEFLAVIFILCYQFGSVHFELLSFWWNDTTHQVWFIVNLFEFAVLSFLRLVACMNVRVEIHAYVW